MRKEYPSDISRKQFEIIKEDLKSVRKTTHTSTYEKRKVNGKKTLKKIHGFKRLFSFVGTEINSMRV